jgi:hypothetical protein
MFEVLLFSAIGIGVIVVIAVIVRWAAGPDRPLDDNDSGAGGVGVVGLPRSPDDPN